MYSSNIHDSKILNLQLDNSNFYNDNNNIILEDSGYDSNIIREKLKILDKDKYFLKKRIKILI